MATDGPAPATGVPAPLEHLLLLIVTVLPLFFPVPTNLNIVSTAAACVLCGCWRSVKPDGPPAESMTRKDAMKFPLMGSIMLFSLFLAFKFLPKDLVNLVLSAYFVLLGTAAIVATADPIVGAYLPSSLSREFTIKFPKIPVVLKEGGEVTFTALEAILAVPAGVFCGWYWTTKHWMANNILGLAFSLQGIEHLSLGAVQNGVILLGGLFFYDVFWVFCTPVMVSVAKSFDAPIKLLFPRVPFPAAAAASKFSMLGLGDIVIPGVFVAIILRYDIAHGDGSPRFFKSAFFGYSAGLAATIAVMNIFQAAQPALLYIVPAVLLTTFAHAAAMGQASHLFHWKETEEEEEEATAAAVAEAKKES